MTATASIDFPDSNWRLELVRDHHNSDVVISLYWGDKAAPTHQVACSVEEFKLMIDAAGLV